MTDRFDLEQEIMQCWNVVEDIEMVTEHFADNPKWAHIPPDVSDAIINKYFGLKELYEIRFQRLWDTFSELITTIDVGAEALSESKEEELSLSYNTTYTVGENFWADASYNVNTNIGDTSNITFTLSDADHDYVEIK